jgi:pimeloyl-ACP methyl ester carboxylesterase
VGDKGSNFGRRLVELANRNHWVLIAPTLRYGDWWKPDVLAREDALVGRWLGEYLDRFESERGVAIQSRVVMFGFSRGGGLVGRVALSQPERVLAAAVLSSGAYTLPLTSDANGAPLAFPFGVADLASHTGREFNAQAFASIRWWVGVGGDDDVAKDVPQLWTVHIGATRLERARSFSAALVKAGAEARLSVFPGTRHMLTPAMKDEAMQSLYAADPAPWVAPTPAPTVAPTAPPRPAANVPSTAPTKATPTSRGKSTPMPVAIPTDVPPTPRPAPPAPAPSAAPVTSLAPMPSMPSTPATPVRPSPGPVLALPQVSESRAELTTRPAVVTAWPRPDPVEQEPPAAQQNSRPLESRVSAPPPPAVQEPRPVAPAPAVEPGEPVVSSGPQAPDETEPTVVEPASPAAPVDEPLPAEPLLLP